MRKGDDGEEKKQEKKKRGKKKKKIMMKIVATNVVASRPPERQGSPATSTARANSTTLNSDLSFDEVSKAIESTKCKKAYLELPNEVTKNKNAKALLHSFFLKLQS